MQKAVRKEKLKVAEHPGSLRDTLEWLKHHPLDSAVHVSDLPVKRPLIVAPDDELATVFETLIRTGASKAVVCDSDHKPVGMLTLFDLLSCGAQPA